MVLVLTGVCPVIAAAADPPAGTRLRIVTTILPLYCFARNVAGDDAVVENLLPPGVEPHDFQFTPREMRLLAGADVLLMNGLGLETWLDRVLAGSEKPHRVVVATGGMTAELIAGAGEAGPNARAGSANPHFWQDPTLAARAVTNLLTALQAADPAHAAAFARNAARYGAELSALDVELQTGLAPLKNQPILTFHDAFPYFARRYGLRVAGVVEPVPDLPPSPRQVAALGALIRREHLRVVFAERQSPARVVEMLGRDYHVAVAYLDPLETGAFAPEAYTRGMRENLHALTGAPR